MNELISKNIIFETQKRFDWLGKQSLDFYLPQYNIAIECQGEQHFHQVYFNGKTEGVEERNLFKNIKKRDKEKFEKCKMNNINILYFIDNKIPHSEIKCNNIYEGNYITLINSLIDYINK